MILKARDGKHLIRQHLKLQLRRSKATNLVQLGVEHTVGDELPLLTDVKGRHDCSFVYRVVDAINMSNCAQLY